MKSIVIFDLDGTLADHSQRVRYVDSYPADWDKFYTECVNDKCVEDVAYLCAAMYRTYRVVILTGRSDRTKADTVEWLKKNDIPYHELIMRPDGNYTRDHVWKKQIADSHGLTPEKVLFVVEDRKRVVDMWRSNGYTCLQAADGDF